MENAKEYIEKIIGEKREFSYSEIVLISEKMNKEKEATISPIDAKWQAYVGHYATENSTHVGLVLNYSDVHPRFRFIATGSGVVRDNKVKFKLKDFSPDFGVEETVLFD